MFSDLGATIKFSVVCFDASRVSTSDTIAHQYLGQQLRASWLQSTYTSQFKQHELFIIRLIIQMTSL